MQEQKLLDLLNKNPEKGLENLMKTYGGYVFTIVTNKLKTVCSRLDIEECVIDIFYELYLKREKINLQAGSIKAFVCTIAKHKSVDKIRQAAQAYTVLQDTETSGEDIEAHIIEKETRVQMIHQIKALGEPENEIFIRKYYLGQTAKEISQILGIKENTINKKVSRGLVKLKDALGGGV